MALEKIEEAKLLIVDDEPANVLLLQRLLEQSGFTNIMTLTDSRKALDHFDTFVPDIILLDIQMPYLDGFDIMKGVADRLPADRYVPILVLTADATVATKRRALAAGANDFVTKPFDALEVVLRVKNLLHTRILHSQLSEQNQCLERMVEERTKQIQHQAFHDSLTGLPNRALFMDRLSLAQTRAQRSNAPMAIFFIDLDNFKTINDSLGHDAGDQLLAAIGERLTPCVRLGDTIARLGGDEFTILMEEADSVEDAIAIADRITAEMSAPFLIDGREIFASASIGIAFQTEVFDSFDTLLRNADAAMYEAKANGKCGYMLFDSTMNDYAADRLELETGLRFALERREFQLHYQPLINLETRDMVGVEALLRWTHPTRGSIPPGKFIPIAEDTGLIVPIGYWVLEEACRQMKSWTDSWPDYGTFTMNINLSGRQLQRPDIVERVREIVAASGVKASSLKLEITESVMMKDMEINVERLHGLKSIGVKLAMDDFGTGYSCMANLDTMPLDTVKIDRAFVQRLANMKEGSDQMVGAIIALSRALNLDVTGEGVETLRQVTQLKGLGCVIAQGYFFAKPLTAEVLGSYIAAGPGAIARACEEFEDSVPKVLPLAA